MLFLREIRIEHTLFALPFAYVGAVFAARGIPSLDKLIWITVAVIGARTAAMAINRYADRAIDARNPRTARRAVASGQLAPTLMLWATGAGIALLVLAAYKLNPLCVALLPLATLGVIVYPFGKRFTWSVHFMLGAVDGLAPLGAYIGVAGTVSWAALAIFLAVTIWVAGFDIIYALMDHDIDVAQNLRSVPAQFGKAAGHVLPILLHRNMIYLLAIAGLTAHVGLPYYAGVALAVGLTVYEWRLLRREKNLFVVNERVFMANMLFSLLFLITTIAGFVFA